MPDLHDQVIDLLSAYRFDEADAACRRALRGVNDPVSRAELLCTLAHIQEAQSKTASARKLYNEVLLLLHRKHGVAILRVRTWRGLGRILRVQGNYPAAAVLLRRAVQQAESLENGRIELSDALGDLGVLYRYSGRLETSVALYQRALEIAESERGLHDPAVANFYHMLAGVNHVRGHLAEAEVQGRKSVQVRADALGSDHPDTVADAACLAAVLIDLGKHDEAETILKHALKIFRKIYGEPHFEIAVSLHNLASIANVKGRTKQAMALFRQSLQMKEKLFGKSHPDLAMTLNNLAVLEGQCGNPEEAATLGRRALRIAQLHLNSTHPTLQLIHGNWGGPPTR
jgi:tetratricopeptide (TPR) repeat protein